MRRSDLGDKNVCVASRCRILHLQAYFREQRLEPKEWGLLMLIIWSDATWLDGAGRHSAHAVTASFGKSLRRVNHFQHFFLITVCKMASICTVEAVLHMLPVLASL